VAPLAQKVARPHPGLLPQEKVTRMTFDLAMAVRPVPSWVIQTNHSQYRRQSFD